MNWAKRIVNRMAGTSKAEARPTPGRMLVPRAEDSVRDYPSAGLTPSRLAMSSANVSALWMAFSLPFGSLGS